MKKMLMVAMICLSFAQVSQAQASNLPFVGTRSFNMLGGNCTVELMTINKNGQVSLKFQGCEGSETYFKGKFSNPLKVQDNGETYYYQIKGNYIYLLDENQQISNQCTVMGRNDTLCIDELNADF